MVTLRNRFGTYALIVFALLFSAVPAAFSQRENPDCDQDFSFLAYPETAEYEFAEAATALGKTSTFRGVSRPPSPTSAETVAQLKAIGLDLTGTRAVGGQAVVLQAVDKKTGEEQALTFSDPANLMWRLSVAETAGGEGQRYIIPAKKLEIERDAIASPWIASTVRSELDNPKIFGPRASAANMLDLWDQMLEGIDYLHSRGILHRDIKSSNLHVEIARHPKKPSKILGVRVLYNDFGLAGIKAEGEDEYRLPPGVGPISGTPSYMGPAIEGKVDRRGDLYALQVVFGEMALGKPIDDPSLDAHTYVRHSGPFEFRKFRYSLESVDPEVHPIEALIEHFPARNAEQLRNVLGAGQVALAAELPKSKFRRTVGGWIGRLKKTVGGAPLSPYQRFLRVYGREIEKMAQEYVDNKPNDRDESIAELGQIGATLFTSELLVDAFREDLGLSDSIKRQILEAMAERYRGVRLKSTSVPYRTPNPWIDRGAVVEQFENFGIAVPAEFRNPTPKPKREFTGVLSLSPTKPSIPF